MQRPAELVRMLPRPFVHFVLVVVVVCWARVDPPVHVRLSMCVCTCSCASLHQER
jgi:hypothetical protein